MGNRDCPSGYQYGGIIIVKLSSISKIGPLGTMIIFPSIP